MSKTLAGLITGFAQIVTALQNKRRRAITCAVASERLQPDWVVAIDGVRVVFHCPTAPAAASAHALSTREPETRAWIRDHVAAGEVLWDIGANCGMFSLYAAQLCRAVVYAFEPNAGTFAILARNVALNGLGELIKTVPIALSSKAGLETYYLFRESAGHAMGAIGAPVNVEGPFAPAGAQSCLALCADEFAALSGVRPPQHIKIDVDGHEPEVLSGARTLLTQVRTVCVELLPGHAAQNERVGHLLSAAGLTPIAPDPAATQGREPQNTVFVRAR